MIKVNTIRQLLQCMNEISDWKFALGLHVRFANPTLLYQTYPQAWIDYYNEAGLVFTDPTVRWAISNIGICDWSDLAAQDANNVFGQAAGYGLCYGKVISMEKGTRTFGFFTHASREIEQSEIEEAQRVLEKLHDATQDAEHLSEKELTALRQLNASL